MIAIIDYGAGNTANVKNAFAKLGVETVVSSSSAIWVEADGIVLPGVGSFGAAMGKLNPYSGILRQLAKEKPFLGICLGMQLLFEKSEESPGVQGLGVFSGTVKKFNGTLPVPHTGWNIVRVSDSRIFDGMKDFYAYFVHSYYCEPQDQRLAAAWTEYGKEFVSAVSSKSIFLTQFHPEKSGETGLRVLGNFASEVSK